MNCYVIGDVHGEYQALLNLISKIPKNSKFIFVGDLIDRGTQSAHVIRLIRKQNFSCVRGNHEEMMIKFGSNFIKDVLNNKELEQDNMWLNHGGKETLLSYGLISMENSKIVPHAFIKAFIFQFQEDISWMKKLPLYLNLNTEHASGRNVVVSHSAIAPVWKLKGNKDEIDTFSNTVLWGRMKPIDTEPIFNIFGHTPQKYVADINNHYVNIDTGCYMKTQKGYGLLSAYCVETGEVYSSSELNYEKVS